MSAAATRSRSARPAPRKRRGIGRPADPQAAVGRDALIDKTCELLRELPPGQVTRAAVARALRVDPSLIRYYFRDRSTLLQAAIERITGEFVTLVEQATDHSDPSPRGQLRARMSAQLRLNATYPFFHRLIVEEIVALDTAASRRLLQQLAQRGLDHYGAIIARGVADGSLREVDPRMLFLAVIGMCEFFVSGMPVVQHSFGRAPPERALQERYRDFICDMVLDGVASHRVRR